MVDDYFNPNKKTAATLARAYKLIQSVPYKVSARWVFYRLLQEGYFSKKSDYKNKWIKYSSCARHSFYMNWHPAILADKTREPIKRGGGNESVEVWLQDLTNYGLSCSLDKWYTQPVYLELWYEARAMTAQFQHYTKHITLRPMGGQPSIPYKWQIAKDLEAAAKKYNKEVIVLYFGDLDPAGQTISWVVERDVWKWCGTDFAFIHCGLTEEQVSRYGVPENPDKPGQYQWEALTDRAAKEIIEGATNQFLHHDAFSEIVEQEEKLEEFAQDYLSSIAEAWNDENTN